MLAPGIGLTGSGQELDNAKLKAEIVIRAKYLSAIRNRKFGSVTEVMQ
jgi:hypothetical protein